MESATALIVSIYHWASGPNGAMLFAVLWGISEALGEIPAIKANSVYGFVRQVIGAIRGRLFGVKAQ